MSKKTSYPITLEEYLVFWCLAGSWWFYALGALYILGPVLGFILLMIYLWRLFIFEALPEEKHPLKPPISIYIWVFSMIAMFIALIIAHIDRELGMAQTIKSSIGWAKGWALIAIYPLIGACLKIRFQVIVRAYGWFALQTLCLIPILVLAGFAGLPEKIFVSPLKIIGGPGPEFFSVYLYVIDPGNGQPRWQFIAPWCPAAGMLANFMLIIVLQEKKASWKYIGILTSCLIILLSKSRIALVAMITIWPLTWIWIKAFRPYMLILACSASLILGMVAQSLIDMVLNTITAFQSARADSSRVRAALKRIAFDRWRTEAPVFGHGIVENGPHYVEYMPIGSHHSWAGLLFVKGLVGFFALAVPLFWSFIEMLLFAPAQKIGRVGLAMVLILFIYTFGENLEILSYLFWPGLIVLGIAHKEAVYEQKQIKLKNKHDST